MALSEQYDTLYRKTLNTVAQSGFHLDEQIGSRADKRYGITLRIRPQANVQDRIVGLVDAVRAIEPDQYYYPRSDMHVTVLSIITCYTGFSLSHIDIPSYTRLIADSIAGLTPFALHFRGITASPSCIMIQGFPSDGTLDKIRDRVRQSFRASSLEQTIDLRYLTTMAHSTVVRLRGPVQDPSALLALLASYRAHDFGTSLVDSLELVANDWCHTLARGQTLGHFPLG